MIAVADLVITEAARPVVLLLIAVFGAAGLAYLVAGVARAKAPAVLRAAGPVLFFIGFAIATAVLAGRWIEAGRPPFKTLFESLLLFAWSTALIYLMLERFYRVALFGVLTSLFVIGVYFYALSKSDVEIVNLPPALQSGWFVPHVVVYFLGYAALFFGFMAAILHLVRPKAQVTLRKSSGATEQMTYAGFMRRAILFGFVLLTIGLVVGAIWAKVAWGDWWTWDPKENWALVSWLVFAIYLHLIHTKGFSERAGAVIVVVGFVVVAFTYLGMHLLPTAEQSVHVYQ